MHTLTAGIEPGRGNGMHALRHFYASLPIDAGERANAAAEFLRHTNPGFTLRVYAHLFPASEARARAAIINAFAANRSSSRSPARLGSWISLGSPRTTPT